MKHRIGSRVLQAGSQRALSVLAACAVLTACQSSTASETREPAKEPSVSGAAPPSGEQARAAAQAQATQPLHGSAQIAAAATPSAAIPSAAAAPAAEEKPAVAPKAVAAADAAKGADGKAPAAAAGAKQVQGAVVTEEAFSTWLQAPSPAKAGAPVQLELVLVAKAPYHCNPEYPHKFKLNAAPAGVSYPEETVKGMKVTPERSVLSIPVNAQAAGKANITGTLSFSVCTAERCMVEKRDLALALDVM